MESENESCDGLDILQMQENMNGSVEKDSAAVIPRNYGLHILNNDNIAESDSMKDMINACTLNIDQLNNRDTHDLSETTESSDAPDDEFSAIENLFGKCITVAEGIPNLCDVTTMNYRGDPQLTHPNQGSCDLKQSPYDGENICHQEPCDLQHQEPCDLQHQEPCDLQVQEPCDLQHREPCDLQNREPYELQHLLKMGKKVCYLFHTMFDESCDDSSDSDSEQDYNSQDSSDSDSQQDLSSSEEGQNNPDLADVFNKFYDVYRKFHGENQCHQLPSDLAERVIAIGRNILKCFNGGSMQSQDDDPEGSSKFYFGSIVKDLLELFTRENGSESGANAKGAGVKTEQWTDDVIDVIHELADFWCHINRFEDNAANMEKNKRELRDKKGAKVHGENILRDCVKTFITDTLKICLWICSGCKEVSAESYEAENVWFWCDGSSSVSDLLSVVCLAWNNSDTASDLDYMKYIYWTFNWITGQLLEPLMRSVSNKSETCPKDPESSFKAPADIFQWIFRLVHWVNENSCQLTNIRRPDTDTKQPIEVIVSCLSSWFYSQILKSEEDRELLIEVVSSARKIVTILILLCLLPSEIGPHLLQGLEIISAISPHCEYFLRNMLHIYLYWVLFIFSNKLPFAEGTSMFGKRCLKEASFLELLYFMLNHQQTPYSGFTELQQIVTNLRADFQIENMSSRCIPDVDTQTEPDNECGSVVDLLWSRYEATLSQSNWCNAVTVVAKMMNLFFEDFGKWVLPEWDEIYLDELSTNLNSVLSGSLSGSRLDGCISLLPGCGNACDFDIMGPICASDHFIMECVQDSPVNVVFKQCPDVNLYFPLFLEHGFVSPKLVKTGFNMFSLVLCSLSNALIRPFHRKFNTAHSFQLGDVAGTFLLFQGQDVIASADYVPAITIDSWPEQAHSWVHRKSHWPACDIRVAIAGNGCHAVPKTTKGGDPDKEWRLSFSKAENTLCKIFTPSQAFHLSLLKTQFQSVKSKIGSSEVRIFKNYSITKGEFHTYHAKTAMFWFCENHPPPHKIWRKENVFRCQSELLESMEGMMREGNIRHYFIPEQNLLEGVAMELIQQAAGELHVLKEDARTENGRVYQQIIGHRHELDHFSQCLSDIWKYIMELNLA